MKKAKNKPDQKTRMCFRLESPTRPRKKNVCDTSQSRVALIHGEKLRIQQTCLQEKLVWQPRRSMGEPYRGHLYKQRDGSLSFTAFVSFSTRHGRHFLRVEFDPAFLQYGYFNPMWDGASEFLAGDLIAMHR